MLESYIKERLQEHDILVMAHAVVGYPSLENNWRMLECMRDTGVALVELQLPFSEPIADGPVFVHANQEALHGGLNWDSYFDFMSRATQEFDFPVLFMGYYNSIFCMGEAAFCQRLADSGANGYIVADLPPEHAVNLDEHAAASGLAAIHIMTPTNSARRLQQITDRASGFIYCVARKGVTGSRTELDKDTLEYIKRCREASNLPLALGFGIRTASDINHLRGQVDIAIIGTACLKTWEQEGEEGFRRFLTSMTGHSG